MTDARLTQAATEVLLDDDAVEARLTQAAVSVMFDQSIEARLTQVAVEVLHSLTEATVDADCPCALEISTPYSLDQLADLQWAQKDDLLLFVQPERAIRVLTHVSEEEFTFLPIAWQDGKAPMLDPNTQEENTITATRISGATFTLDAVEALFPELDGGQIGRAVRLRGQRAASDTFIGEDMSSPGVADSLPNTHLIAYQFPVLTAGDIRSIQLYTTTAYTGGIKVAVYSQSLERQQAGVRTLTGASGWIDIPLDAVVPVEAGTSIWLAIHAENTFVVRHANAPIDTGRIKITTLTYAAGMPAVLGTGTADISAIGIRAAITEEGDTVEAWFNITARASNTSVTAKRLSAGGTVPQVAVSDWSLGAMSDTMGARAITFHEGRMVLAGFVLAPDRVMLSDSNNYQRFTEGSDDSDAIARTASSGHIDLAQWVASSAGLLWIGTAGGEYIMTSNDTILTPTSAQIKPLTQRGSIHHPPVTIDGRVVFVQDRKLRALVRGDAAQDQAIALELTVLHEHITGPGIKTIAYQQDPNSVLWLARTDGELVGITYEDDGGVIVGHIMAAHRHTIGGAYMGDDSEDGAPQVESLATVPGDDGDQLWVIVKRTVGGQVKRYVELMQPFFTPRRGQGWADTLLQRTRAVRHAWHLDSALKFDTPVAINAITNANPGVVTAEGHGASDGDHVLLDHIIGMPELEFAIAVVTNSTLTTFELFDLDGAEIDTTAFGTYLRGGEMRLMTDTFFGLEHLEGEEVTVWADGVLHDPVTVVGGEIVLTREAAVVIVGLPTAWVIETERFVTGGRIGTVQGQRHRFQRLAARLLDTTQLSIGTGPAPTLLETPDFSDGKFVPNLPGAAIPDPLFSGDVEKSVEGGWSDTPTAYMAGSTPAPATVLAVMPRAEVGER